MADGDLLPELYIWDMPWKLDRFQGVRMFNSGNSQVNEQAEPRWMIEVATRWLDDADFQEMDSWIVDRQGAGSTFLTWRMSRPFGRVPVVSDVGLSITAVDRAASTISYGNTGTWTVTKGDMLSHYTEAGGYWCGMAMETRAASGGNMLGLKVSPNPWPAHATLAAPRRIRALAEFQLLLPVPTPIERVDERMYNFNATQIIRG